MTSYATVVAVFRVLNKDDAAHMFDELTSGQIRSSDMVFCNVLDGVTPHALDVGAEPDDWHDPDD